MEPEEIRMKYGLRVDGRTANELRRIRVKLGVFEQPDGSAYVEQGLTKVLSTVHGPHQPKGNVSKVNANTSREIINVKYKISVFGTPASERKYLMRKAEEWQLKLRDVMEAIILPDLISRSQIDIFICVLQGDGSEFCVAVNAATLALIDAGIPIKGSAIACSVTLIDSALIQEDSKNEGIGLVDANYVEECSRGATIYVVVSSELLKDSSNANPIIWAETSGERLHISRLKPITVRAINACRDIKVILEESVRNHLHTFSVHSAIG